MTSLREYSISIQLFYRRYTAGELEENMDYMEWSAREEGEV